MVSWSRMAVPSGADQLVASWTTAHVPASGTQLTTRNDARTRVLPGDRPEVGSVLRRGGRQRRVRPRGPAPRPARPRPPPPPPPPRRRPLQRRRPSRRPRARHRPSPRSPPPVDRRSRGTSSRRICWSSACCASSARLRCSTASVYVRYSSDGTDRTDRLARGAAAVLLVLAAVSLTAAWQLHERTAATPGCRSR